MKIERSALVTHNAMDIYKLVQDVPSYPRFLSWCTSARVFEQTDEMQTAQLSVAVAGIRQQFTTVNTLKAGRHVGMQLLKGPFRKLCGEWRFKQLGEHGSKVSLVLDFEMANGLASKMFGEGFGGVANRLVSDFCKRADEVYG